MECPECGCNDWYEEIDEEWELIVAWGLIEEVQRGAEICSCCGYYEEFIADRKVIERDE